MINMNRLHSHQDSHPTQDTTGDGAPLFDTRIDKTLNKLGASGKNPEHIGFRTVFWRRHNEVYL